MKTEPWIILTDRLGRDVRTPTESQIAEAIRDLRVHQDDGEHGIVSLRRGLDDGPIWLIELSNRGNVTYSEYKDADFEELASKLVGESLGMLDIARRFYYLLRGDLFALSACQWNRKEK
ncbi:MAG TPA: hypothetical protein VL357_09710 [Rariglobus sp.]|jgi:hypothetical protein|nr:hypothetical protein [Rariglobus sp.]